MDIHLCAVVETHGEDHVEDSSHLVINQVLVYLARLNQWQDVIYIQESPERQLKIESCKNRGFHAVEGLPTGHHDALETPFLPQNTV
jgi:hypothetical protein